jgi:hypothetical protein
MLIFSSLPWHQEENQERRDEHEPMVEKTRVETARSKGRGVKMRRRNHKRRIKPMESELAMGLVGRPTHRINFLVVLEHHRHN